MPFCPGLAVPPIGSGEIALYVAGAGHFLGSGGKKFVSDVNILNPHGSRSVDDAKMYYTAATGSAASSKQASLGPVPNQVSVSVADVVNTVFSGANELGTLQIRSKDASLLSVSANTLTTSNPSGTFGNAIPVFRSDRSIDSGATLVLTGLRKDSTTHTNLYLQETAGFPSTVQIDYVALNGALAIRSIMKLTLSADHRIVDGATGARFVNAIRRRLEDAATLRDWARNG